MDRPNPEALRAFRTKKLGLTQAEMAKNFGVGRSTYAHWEEENGPQPMPDRYLPKLVELGWLNRTAELDAVLGGLTASGTGEVSPVPRARLDYGLRRVEAMPMVKIRVVGSVAAGQGSDDHADEAALYVPDYLGGDDVVGWLAEGDSMMPWIQPGDIVLAKEHKEKRPNLPHIVRTGEGVRVKMISFEQPKGWLYRSLNKAYVDEEVKQTDEIIGYVTGIYRIDNGTSMILSNPKGLKPDL